MSDIDSFMQEFNEGLNQVLPLNNKASIFNVLKKLYIFFAIYTNNNAF